MEACENCGRQIGNLETPYALDGHVVCANCHAALSPQQIGYAHSVAAVAPPPRRVQTVEQTGKGWKLALLVSVLTIIVGVVALAIGFQGNHAATAVGALAFVAGLIGYTISRIGAWWCHG